MVLHGQVKNGSIIMSENAVLPEGAEVTVIVPSLERTSSDRIKRSPGGLPVVPSKHPGTVNLTSERVAELLEADDFAS
jgi:hypothetical protein